MQRSGRTVLRHKRGNAPDEGERVLIFKAHLVTPRMFRIPQRVTFAVILPPKDTKDKLHPIINLTTGLLSTLLHVPLISTFICGSGRHGRVDSLLHVLVCHAEAQHSNESSEPLVAALGGLEDLLHFVEDSRDAGFLNAGEEEFELPVGHAGGGEFLDLGLAVV